MFEKKPYIVFAVPVMDLTIARYLAARDIEYIGIPIDFDHLKKTQQLIYQFKEWLEGPKLIGIYSGSVLIPELESLDGYYHPEIKMFYQGKLDSGLLKTGLPEHPHEFLYHILDKDSTPKRTPFSFLEMDLSDDPNEHSEFIGFVIHPGIETETGIYDFENLDRWFDCLEILQKNEQH